MCVHGEESIFFSFNNQALPLSLSVWSGGCCFHGNSRLHLFIIHGAAPLLLSRLYLQPLMLYLSQRGTRFRHKRPHTCTVGGRLERRRGLVPAQTIPTKKSGFFLAFNHFIMIPHLWQCFISLEIRFELILAISQHYSQLQNVNSNGEEIIIIEQIQVGYGKLWWKRLFQKNIHMKLKINREWS